MFSNQKELRKTFYQVPSLHCRGPRLQIFSFALEVEERKKFGVTDGNVGNDALAVDAEEAATAAGDWLLERELLGAEVQELVDFGGVTEADQNVPDGKRILAKVAVVVFEVDLVEKSPLGFRDVGARDSVAGVDFRRKNR